MTNNNNYLTSPVFTKDGLFFIEVGQDESIEVIDYAYDEEAENSIITYSTSNGIEWATCYTNGNGKHGFMYQCRFIELPIDAHEAISNFFEANKVF